MFQLIIKISFTILVFIALILFFSLMRSNLSKLEPKFGLASVSEIRLKIKAEPEPEPEIIFNPDFLIWQEANQDIP